MGWATYWAPNLVTWIVGAAITAVVGAAVGFLFRRWLNQVFGKGGEVIRGAVASVETAAGHAKAAAASAANAQRLTEATNLSTEELERAVVFLADALGKSLSLQEQTKAEAAQIAAFNDQNFTAMLRAQMHLQQVLATRDVITRHEEQEEAASDVP